MNGPFAALIREQAANPDIKMTFTETEQRLSQITDEGLFEKLATAVLRAAEPDYSAIIHTGVNADGKTIKSPMDGILYQTNINPPRLFIIHHTITAVGSLRSKWLHDPTTVKPRGGRKPAAPPGDVLKAIAIVADARQKTANLRATIVLTTNQEPDAETAQAVSHAVLSVDIDIDIWHRSRFADFLDNTPKGQWLRREYLGIDAQRLSRDLLLKLSTTSTSLYQPRDTPEAWVARDLDGAVAAATAKRQAIFLVAPSGLGKSIAGYRWLTDHVTGGGAGLVLSHDDIAGAVTLDDAIDLALRKLCPSLVRGAGAEALALSSLDEPLYLFVEDINVSGQPALLAERIESWTRTRTEGSSPSGRHFRLICPIWPEILTSMTEATRKAVAALAVFGSSFTAAEGCRAVQRRAVLSGRPLSEMSANSVSAALGHDPLLIALHDPSKTIPPEQIIGNYIEGTVGRVAIVQQDFTAADYRDSLRRLAGAALQNLKFDPLWRDVRHWEGIDADDLRRLTHLLHDGSILHLSGTSSEQRIGYRHDRVRDWLLIDAAEQLAITSALPIAIVAEPYFSEILGGVIARGHVGADFVLRVRTENPLALFHALRLIGSSTFSLYAQVISAIEEWLSDSTSDARSSLSLRWEALAVLAETEGPDVTRLVSLFKHRGWTASQARLRNGDIGGGIDLCATVEPGTQAVWHDIQLAHAKHKFGRNLILKIGELLQRRNVDAQFRIGALRLAGHMGDPALADAIAICWTFDSEREKHLDDYLWACAECCGTDAEKYLQPVCEAWAALPDSKEGETVEITRDGLAADHVRWAFRRWVPREAIKYFVERGENEDLRGAITYMLGEIDDPIAVDFTVRQMAEMARRIEGSDRFSPYFSMLPYQWRRHQREDGVGMSDASRRPLQALWTDPGTDKHLRSMAFRVWAATHAPDDLSLLRDSSLPGDLANSVLQERLQRSDLDALPALLKKIEGSEGGSGWWHSMKHVWSDDLVGILDAELERRSNQVAAEWHVRANTDHATSDLIMRLSPSVAELVLKKHWLQLQFTGLFVQAALYVATTDLREMAGKAIAACPEPKTLLQYVGQHMGLHTEGHPGIVRQSQIAALAPYLGYMAKHEVDSLWEICNRMGWFEIRRSLLDPFLREKNGILYEDEAPTFAALDDMVQRNQTHWLNHWLERYAKTGATTDMIVTRVAAWLAKRKTAGALILTQQVLVHIGRRADLGILDIALDSPGPFDDAIRADAIFAVKRRTLD